MSNTIKKRKLRDLESYRKWFNEFNYDHTHFDGRPRKEYSSYDVFREVWFGALGQRDKTDYGKQLGKPI